MGSSVNSRSSRCSRCGKKAAEIAAVGEARAARSPEEHTLKSGLLSEQLARTVDALAALLRVSTLKLSTPVAEPQS
jgi:hypothetical protein